MLKKSLLGLVLMGCCTLVSAQTINNAGVKRLEQSALALFANMQAPSESASRQFLISNRFDIDDVQWQKAGQVIHGPYHIRDGEEEGDNVPYAFVYNQGKNVVGIGGWLNRNWVNQLNALPNVKCKNLPKDPQLWVCAHQAAPVAATNAFIKQLTWLSENAN